ncbi:peptidylprolyl isomerase, partial [Sphingomonas bacterium]|uniref:peptidylprolyl isomerase n=1 Tax=Sphingomonas bacterium TaxID=1895847 RepID=UPI0015763C19
MLGFFRRIIKSRLGLVVTFVLLGAAALAFAASDVTGLRTTGMGGLTGNDAAKVGKGEVTIAQLRSRAQSDMEGFRQQQPTLDMATYINGGGLDGSLARLITSLAFTEFGTGQGMAVSKRTVDGQIASIPGLQSATGQFSPQIYQQLLAQRHLTDQGIREDIARDTMAQQLVLPTSGATQTPMQLALPYASLLLEQRSGSIGFVPAKAMAAGPAPTDAEVATFYRRNVGRYGLPQRRVIRYAIVTPDQVRAESTPTDADVAAAYKAQAARFAATERRTIQQVVVLDQAGAAAIAAKVKGGQSIADAAKAAGLEASTRSEVDKAAYAATSSPAVADAVFAAAKGAVVGPVRGPLGFTVAAVQSIDQVAAKSLEQAKPLLLPELTKQKTQVALAAIHDAIDDALAKNATFDEVVADRKLTPVTTPALAANGVDPTIPGAKPDPMLAQVVAAGYAAQDGDSPQMVPMGTDGGFAVVALGKRVPAAPRPLGDVRAAVVADLLADRARQAARVMA